MMISATDFEKIITDAREKSLERIDPLSSYVLQQCEKGFNEGVDMMYYALRNREICADGIDKWEAHGLAYKTMRKCEVEVDNTNPLADYVEKSQNSGVFRMFYEIANRILDEGGAGA